MARKDLLKGLMEAKGDGADPPARVDPARPRYNNSAIGAVSRSIADLKARSIVEIDPFDITDTGLQDRLEHDDAEHDQLVASIREYGQQVPVLVRPDPGADGKYLIVYGRRRVLALRDLTRPVKAMIRDLDDEAALLAQGQENTARRDLSFIEKANFARQMTEAGYARRIVCDALSIDKTVISRMLSVAERVPPELIAAIGAAPGIGRDRWLAFAELWAASDLDVEAAVALFGACPADSSDARFEMLLQRLETGALPAPARKRAAPPKRPLAAADGRRLGDVVAGERDVTIRLNRRAGAGFEDWLVENIEEIHRDWKKQRGE